MAASLGSRMCMAAFILGWAGLSVHCQVLSFIGQSGLSTRTYFFGKLLHGFLSAGLVWLLSVALGWNDSVSAILAGQVTTIARLSFRAGTDGLSEHRTAAGIDIRSSFSVVRRKRGFPSAWKSDIMEARIITIQFRRIFHAVSQKY